MSGTTWTTVTLQCDAPGCDTMPFEAMATSMRLARLKSARDGWTNRGHRDFCPEHSKVTDDARAESPRR